MTEEHPESGTLRQELEAKIAEFRDMAEKDSAGEAWALNYCADEIEDLLE